MPTPSASIGSGSPLLWLVGLFVLGFGVAWLLTDLGGMPRSPYIFFLALSAGAFTAAYLIWSETDTRDFLLHHWGWGLAGAAITGGLLARAITSQPARLPRHGARLAVALAWEGVVYGATEGLLLSVLPVLLVWQSGWLAGWRDGGAVAAGVLGLVASAALIVVHHLGYRGFRGPQVLVVMAACSLLSIAYLLTASALAPIVGHVIMHIGAVVHGAEMPPYADGQAEAFTFGPRHGPGVAKGWG
ncbi:MAG: hypothetical protein AB7R89_00995 [Dehalococcoidia bacterium]